LPESALFYHVDLSCLHTNSYRPNLGRLPKLSLSSVTYTGRKETVANRDRLNNKSDWTHVLLPHSTVASARTKRHNIYDAKPPTPVIRHEEAQHRQSLSRKERHGSGGPRGSWTDKLPAGQSERVSATGDSPAFVNGGGHAPAPSTTSTACTACHPPTPRQG
jgi:hypothetical protein